MIDTIVLRLHDLRKYQVLIKRLELKNNVNFSTETGVVEQDEVRKLRNMGFRKPKAIIDILRIHKTGDFIVKTKAGKHVNVSSHYAFTYFINWTRDFIEFNFSIPKYRFGSNVVMFVEHFGDKNFSYSACSKFDHNIERVPVLLFSFLKNFFHKEFCLDKIDLKDVEVNRIDVCFNQVFSSKADALKYLEYQKRLKKKYAQDEEGVMREYATSLMYVTKRYSAKIYHKGTEYEKNDLKEHLRINKEKGFEYFETKRFKAFADRILRYELTIRNSYLTYLFKHNIFRNKCGIFQKEFACYTKVHNTTQRNDRIAKAAGKLPDHQRKKYLELNPYEKINKDDRRTYKDISKLLNAKVFFMLEVDAASNEYNKRTVSNNSNRARFGISLTKLCLLKLKSFIDEFQIKELPIDENIKALIENYNRWATEKLPLSEMVRFHQDLLKHGSFKEVRKYGNYSRATLYRYISRFKKIGITEANIKPVDGYKMPEVDVDLKAYYYVIQYQNNLLRGIKIC